MAKNSFPRDKFEIEIGAEDLAEDQKKGGSRVQKIERKRKENIGLKWKGIRVSRTEHAGDTRDQKRPGYWLKTVQYNDHDYIHVVVFYVIVELQFQ